MSNITKIGSAGVNLIKRFEGFSSRPYRDAVGVWTIGYGHTSGVGPHSHSLTGSQGAALLKKDLDKKYSRYISALRLPLNQNQFDALVSFVYNVGGGGVASNTGVGRALRSHRWHDAANELLRWDKAGGRTLAGLTRRRHDERTLFLKHSSSKDLTKYLTSGEKKYINKLQSERRSAHRHGGWGHIDSSHLKNASAAKKWLQDRSKILTGSKYNRKERKEYVDSVIHDRVKGNPKV